MWSGYSGEAWIFSKILVRQFKILPQLLSQIYLLILDSRLLFLIYSTHCPHIGQNGLIQSRRLKISNSFPEPPSESWILLAWEIAPHPS